MGKTFPKTAELFFFLAFAKSCFFFFFLKSINIS